MTSKEPTEKEQSDSLKKKEEMNTEVKKKEDMNTEKDDTPEEDMTWWEELIIYNYST
jgi:hypothetical protein